MLWPILVILLLPSFHLVLKQRLVFTVKDEIITSNTKIVNDISENNAPLSRLVFEQMYYNKVRPIQST